MIKEAPQTCFKYNKQILLVCWLCFKYWPFFSSNQVVTCIYTGNVSPSTDQLISDIMNINELNVIMLQDYSVVWCQIPHFGAFPYSNVLLTFQHPCISSKPYAQVSTTCIKITPKYHVWFRVVCFKAFPCTIVVFFLLFVCNR